MYFLLTAWELGVVVFVAPLPRERRVSAVSEGPPADACTWQSGLQPTCINSILLTWHLQVSGRRCYFRYHGWKASEYWYSSWIISRLCVSSIHSIWMWERNQDCAGSGEYNIHGFPLVQPVAVISTQSHIIGDASVIAARPGVQSLPHCVSVMLPP